MSRRSDSRRRLGLRLAMSACLLATAWACASVGWKPLGAHRTARVEGAENVGSGECLVCHESVQGHEKIASYHAECESCHGAGSLHIESEALADTRFPASGDCLSCHSVARDTHLEWPTGEHERAGLICSDCHNPHAISKKHLRTESSIRFPHADAASRLCVQCHSDVAAQLNYPSHHTVREGMLSCLDCHDPHGDSRVLVGDSNQRCAGCHQDVMGPWVYEHPPVVESCMSCHAPHGSPVDELLTTPSPAICLSCHPVNDLWHHDVAGTGIFTNTTISENFPTSQGELIEANETATFLGRCTDCHGAIHGSYTDEHLRH